MREWCGAEEETQVCSLVWYPGQAVIRLNMYMVMTIAAVC